MCHSHWLIQKANIVRLKKKHLQLVETLKIFIFNFTINVSPLKQTRNLSSKSICPLYIKKWMLYLQAHNYDIILFKRDPKAADYLSCQYVSMAKTDTVKMIAKRAISCTVIIKKMFKNLLNQLSFNKKLSATIIQTNGKNKRILNTILNPGMTLPSKIPFYFTKAAFLQQQHFHHAYFSFQIISCHQNLKAISLLHEKQAL